MHRGFPAAPFVGPGANVFFTDYDASELAPDGEPFISCQPVTTADMFHDIWSVARGAAAIGKILFP